METRTAQDLRVAVVGSARSDQTFRRNLLHNGAKAVADRFGDSPLKVRVEVEGENELSILLPQRTDELARTVERVVTGLADRAPTRGEFEAQVVYRAWTEPDFLARLRSDARGALDSMLRRYSASVPEQASVRVYEEKPGECLIVLPPVPASERELSDAKLESVAGGRISLTGIVSTTISGPISGAISSRIIDDIWAKGTIRR